MYDMAEAWEYKSAKIPSDRSGARTRALNRLAADGWEVVDTQRDRLRWARGNTDTVTLRRPATYRAEQKAERKRERAEAAARFDSRWESRKARTHIHEWVDRTSSDDRRNGVRFETCPCGASQTVSAEA